MSATNSESFPYFLTEAIVMSIVSVVLLYFSAKQIIYNYAHNEKWRSLIASHHLNAVSIVLLCMTNFDPAAGLGVFTSASVSFLSDTTAFIQIASGSALAASFLEGYQLMVMANHKGPSYTAIGLFVMHTAFLLLGLLIFGYCAITRNAWAAVFSRATMAVYSLAVCIQIIYSAAKIRNLLYKEFKRNGKYAVAVRKLTRLIIAISLLLVIGNIGNGIVMAGNMQEAAQTPKLAIPVPVFNPGHLLTDVTSLLTPALLLVGGWRVADYTGKATKSTTPMKDVSDHVGGRDVEMSVLSSGNRPAGPTPTSEANSQV